MAIVTSVMALFKAIPITQWIGKLIGSSQGTDYDRFGRTVYRLCAAQAAATQLDVYAFWFGQTIRTQPNGQFMVVAHPLVISSFETYINQLKLEGLSFYVIRCGVQVDWEDPGQIQQGCHMDPYGPKTANPTPSPGPVPGPGPSTAGFIGLAALAGAALAFLWKK